MLSRFELRRFRGLLPVAALLFALLVPVIYGAVYLSANWDPYGRLGDLPVAIVNDDRPVEFDGQQIHAGRDIEDELVAQHTFDWRRTDRLDAENGLAEGRYYLVLEIPEGFSADLVSPSTTDPRRAQITLRRNDANGFVIGSVTGAAQSKIENAVDKAAVDAYFKAVFANLAKIRTGMASAADGSAQLASGLATADDGAAKLASGLTTAHDGATRLADGASELNANMPALKKGATDLAAGLDHLDAGSATLASGAHQVADGTQQLRDTVVPALDQVVAVQDRVAGEVAKVDAAVQTVNGALIGDGAVSASLATARQQLDAAAAADPAFAASPAYARAAAALADAAATAGRVERTAATAAADSAADNPAVQPFLADGVAADARDKVTRLNDGAHQVASGADSLHAGLATAGAGARKLSTGVDAVAGGVGQLSTGAGTLASGLGELSSGATDLGGGLGKLRAGASELADGLATGLKQIPALTTDQADAAALVLSAPVEVGMDVQNPATTYGRGLAPMFFSIAMWVFGISGFLVMRPISGRLLAGRLYPLRLAIAAWVPFGSVAVAGAMLMLAITWFGLGLAPVNPVATVGLTLLAALVFSGIAHLMRMALGLPGSAILLVWLVLQLSSTGGTYPTAVLPPFFQWLHPFMPITYTIDAYRIAISGGLGTHLVRDVAVLVGIGAVAMALDVLAVMRRQRFSIADLHPPLQH